MLFPFYSVIVMSISTGIDSLDVLGRLIPRKIDFTAYRFVFNNTFLLTGIKNTLIVVLIGVPLDMLLTTSTAYAISKKRLFMRSFFLNLIVFTMFFGGGLIPFYLLVTSTLGLRDSLWAVILPSALNTFNVIITKNYFQSLPAEIEESAKIDGGNDIRIFWSIAIPISLPILAVITLFTSVGRWNEWFNSMLFLTKSNGFTLQLVLREIVVRTEILNAELTARNMMNPTMSMSVKCAATVITMAPIMCLYPFLQKYFVKGLLIGSIKS
jgi:putative aldouronate transport system permease protein